MRRPYTEDFAKRWLPCERIGSGQADMHLVM